MVKILSAKWHYRFINKAHHISTWSKDKVKVGAVIYDNKNRPVSEGFNGLPRNLPDEHEIYAEDTRVVLHAEVNAILFADRDKLIGSTMYVTMPTCALCAALIIQSGISRVVYEKNDLEGKWGIHADVAKKMYALAGVELIVLDKKEKYLWNN